MNDPHPKYEYLVRKCPQDTAEDTLNAMGLTAGWQLVFVVHESFDNVVWATLYMRRDFYSKEILDSLSIPCCVEATTAPIGYLA